ncbi:hypothetical protein RND81_08G113700 [Saponaria officinalis]|uniref:Uncharacterized protein n=1 Tax=Saponaria officinalis TaxID=3572 RepID=A0AAW1J7L3_SAPOF
MSKIWEMGRKAMFYIRVLSGYEERRIRSYRLQLEQRVRSAQARKEAVKKVPEQVILSEVRRMVDEMKNLNKRLEEMESEINDYFKPIDKEVGAVIDMQMDREKAKMEMMKRALIERAEAQASLEANLSDNAKTESLSGMFKQAMLEKAEAEAPTEVSNSQKQAAQ